MSHHLAHLPAPSSPWRGCFSATRPPMPEVDSTHSSSESLPDRGEFREKFPVFSRGVASSDDPAPGPDLQPRSRPPLEASKGHQATLQVSATEAETERRAVPPPFPVVKPAAHPPPVAARADAKGRCGVQP